MKRAMSPAILTLCAVILPAGLVIAQEAPKAAAVETPAAAQAPLAVIDEPVKDAGVVAKGDKITHDFVIKNTGQVPLEITDVKPSCGCTVAEFDHTIPPGGSGRVHAVVDTIGFSGPTVKTITVFTNDPAHARLELTVKADVQPYLYVQPGYARFIQPQGSDPGVVDNILLSRTFDDLQIEKIESPYPFLTVTSRPAKPEERQDQGKGNQWILTFTIDYAKAPIGNLADYVTVTTNHPKQPVAKIPVSGFVRPMMSVTPTVADFGQIDVSKPQTARMVLRSFAPVDVAITSAESSVPGVDVSVTPIEEGKRFSVEVTLKPDMPKGAFDGKITIHTDYSKSPVVEVPLKGTAI